MPYCVELKSGAIFRYGIWVDSNDREVGDGRVDIGLMGCFEKLFEYKKDVVAVWWDCEGRSLDCGGRPIVFHTTNAEGKCRHRHSLRPDQQEEWNAVIANNYQPCRRRSFY